MPLSRIETDAPGESVFNMEGEIISEGNTQIYRDRVLLARNTTFRERRAEGGGTAGNVEFLSSVDTKPGVVMLEKGPVELETTGGAVEVELEGELNDLRFDSASGEDVRIRIVSGDRAEASYESGERVLTLTIEEGVTDAGQLRDLANAATTEVTASLLEGASLTVITEGETHFGDGEGDDRVGGNAPLQSIETDDPGIVTASARSATRST